jgi:osmotically-inducible protein OsmY
MDEPQQPMTGHASSAAAPCPGTCELAESKLRRSGFLAMQQLSCAFRAGVLTVRGHLPSYFLKQMALALVAEVEGVERIDDQVEVATHAATSASSEVRSARRP